MGTTGPELYPPIEPYAEGMLDVGDGVRVHWEECGDPDGQAALVLHGGPGGGTHRVSRCFFDPDAYRVVLFDQRGSGRSTPHAVDPETDLSTNTTWHLVADIERLRERLGIDRWLVFGGSWGATLALAYAQRHPERVTAVVMGPVTIGSRREIDWIARGGVAPLFPEEWHRFRHAVPGPDRESDVVDAYARLLADPVPSVRAAAADEWCRWELALMAPEPEEDPFIGRFADPGYRFTFARVVTHYFRNDCFLAPDQLLRDVARLAGIPGVLVHGRRDLGSPLLSAWLLARAWPDAQLVVVGDAGHTWGEDPMGSALVEATDRFRSRLR